MYLVKIIGLDGSEITIHSPDSRNVKLLTGDIKRPMNGNPSFDFSFLPNNPAYGRITPMQTRVLVYRTDKGKLVFDGRVLQPTDAMQDTSATSTSFTAEGTIGYLRDYRPPYKTLTGSWQSVVTAALSLYNGAVESWKQIQVGSIGSGGNLTLELTPETNMYDTLYALIVTNNSHDWRVRTSDKVHYLDVNSAIGETLTNPEIRLAYNLKSMTVEKDPTSVVTRVVPLGATKETTDNATLTVQPRYSLADFGKQIFVESEELRAVYGVHYGTVTSENVKDANGLADLANAYLKAETPITTKYTLNALDLSAIGVEADDFTEGNYYHVVNPIMNVDDNLRVNEVELNITDPTQEFLSIGDRMKRQTDWLIETQQSQSETIAILRGELFQAANRANNAANQVFASMASVSLTASKSGDKQITYSVSLNGDNSGTVQVEVSSDGGGTWSTAGGSPLAVTAYGTYQLRAKGVYGNYSTKYSSVVSVQLAAPASTGIGDANGVIIDVSEFQGSINWPSVVAGGLSLATIRVQSGYTYADKTYTTNIPNAIASGANYAVYAYFAGLDSDDAKDEAKSFVSRAKAAIGSSRAPRFWMVDVEEISVTSGTMRDAVSAYMDQLNSLGIPDSQIVLYIANQLYDTFNLDVGRAAGIWIPSYGANDGTVGGSSKPNHPYDLWQYTSKGRVSGITGDVDMSTNPSTRMKTLINNK